jgi:serine/threonine protein phosphatase PrpC
MPLPPPPPEARPAPHQLLVRPHARRPGAPNNEDTFLALTFDGHEVRFLGKTGQASLAGSDFVFAVSDGMGGAKSGEFASRIAVDRITRLLPRGFRFPPPDGASGFSRHSAGTVFRHPHRPAQPGRSYEECAGMGATLSLCWFTPEWLYFGTSATVGSITSRRMAAPQVTHDHSMSAGCAARARINEREARATPSTIRWQCATPLISTGALGAGHQFIETPAHRRVVTTPRHRPGDRPTPHS